MTEYKSQDEILQNGGEEVGKFAVQENLRIKKGYPVMLRKNCSWGSNGHIGKVTGFYSPTNPNEEVNNFFLS